MKRLLLLIALAITTLSQAQVRKKTAKPEIEKEWINPVKLTREERNRPYMNEVLKTKDYLTPKEAERRRKNIAAGNPFAKYGYYPKVATLSRGKYLEFHDKDSIVVIGSVKYNTKQQKVIEVLDIDLSDPDAHPIGDTHGRWMSPDPLSEEFSSWSPYNFVFSNPLKYIDPDGMAPTDDYKLLKNGKIKLIARTNDSFDRLYATDNKGNVDQSKNVTVDKAKPNDRSIIGDLAKASIPDSKFSEGINFGRTSNASDAANVFNFVAKNSNVEWGLDAYKVNDKPLYTVYTGHSNWTTPPNFQNQSMSKLLFEIHSHKNINEPSPVNGATDGDYGIARQGDRIYYNKTGSNKYPGHYLYYTPNQGKNTLWKYYWHNTSKIKVGSTINLKSLK